MERQFLRIFYILFFLVGCQQVEINKLETTAKEKNLDSSLMAMRCIFHQIHYWRKNKFRL